MRKILFLDIDGVLHGDLTGKLVHVGLFEHYLRQLPGVEVVVSSTWREDLSLDELRALFDASLHERFTGVTPILDDGCDSAGREREIAAWLASEGLHAGNARWAAIDDWPQLFSAGCEFLVLTDGRYGFSERDGEALLARLGANAQDGCAR